MRVFQSLRFIYFRWVTPLIWVNNLISLGFLSFPLLNHLSFSLALVFFPLIPLLICLSHFLLHTCFFHLSIFPIVHCNLLGPIISLSHFQFFHFSLASLSPTSLSFFPSFTVSHFLSLFLCFFPYFSYFHTRLFSLPALFSSSFPHYNLHLSPISPSALFCLTVSKNPWPFAEPEASADLDYCVLRCIFCRLLCNAKRRHIDSDALCDLTWRHAHASACTSANRRACPCTIDMQPLCLPAEFGENQLREKKPKRENHQFSSFGRR